ncbi:MAG: zf-HC2 domain-containing protein [Terracidiphilus sp.]|jgi:predicted anti-sigma-YlaC factor YlaD
MTCTEFLAILDDVLDESIAVETRTEIENHLRKCGHCEVVLNTMRKTIEIFQCHEIYEVPTEVSERLHIKIMERCKKVK